MVCDENGADPPVAPDTGEIPAGGLKPLRARTLVGLGLLFLLAYHANFSTIYQVDTVPGPYIAWSLLHERDFDLDEFIPVLRKYCGLGLYFAPSGHWVSRYPPGNGIMALPSS